VRVWIPCMRSWALYSYLVLEENSHGNGWR